MTNKEYVDTLKHIASIPTVYNNRFPRNLGYWDGKQFSFDCWNLIKSVIDGWKDCRQLGYYVHPLKPTGDIDGATILKKCTFKSKDFKQLSISGAYLYMKGHAGTYIGDVEISGHIYNVIECTASWSKNVLYSYVDENGNRKKYKGGANNGKWTDWGLMCWIDYTDKTPAQKTYMYKGVDYSPVFDSSYYREHNADVVKVYGNEDSRLFAHFTDWGMKEGRKGSLDFDVNVYKANNKDLVAAYGSDLQKYYEHYCRYGKNENRKHN